MEIFPSELKPSEAESFKRILFEERTKLLRKETYFHVLQKIKEDDYFDLFQFDKLNVKNLNETRRMAEIIQKELRSLGWETSFGFGDTALFVYTGNKPWNAT